MLTPALSTPVIDVADVSDVSDVSDMPDYMHMQFDEWSPHKASWHPLGQAAAQRDEGDAEHRLTYSYPAVKSSQVRPSLQECPHSRNPVARARPCVLLHVCCEMHKPFVPSMTGSSVARLPHDTAPPRQEGADAGGVGRAAEERPGTVYDVPLAADNSTRC
eukprot:2792190-Prymnesium_polylepis.1